MYIIFILRTITTYIVIVRSTYQFIKGDSYNVKKSVPTYSQK